MMKLLLKTTLVLLGFTFLFASCKKEGGTSGIVGTWRLSEMDCYLDNSLIETVGTDSDSYFEYAKGMGTFGPEMMFFHALQVTFESDGTCSVYGYTSNYNIENGRVLFDGEDDGFRFTDGILTLTVVDEGVSSYVDNYGTTHKGRSAKVIGKYKKR